MVDSQLEALVHAATERQITVAELNSATRTLAPREREFVYELIRRRQRERGSRLTLVHRSTMSAAE
jgi:hypothetical protein